MNWDDKISASVRAVPPSGIRKFFDLANTMEGVISLGVGEPDFSAPDRVIEACIKSLKEKRLLIHRIWVFRNCVRRSPSCLKIIMTWNMIRIMKLLSQ